MNIRDADATKTLNKAEVDLLQMKSAQRIAGDSWKLYRYTGNFLPPANTRLYLVFRTNNDLLATVKLDQESWTYQVYPTGVTVENNNRLYVFVTPPIMFPDPEAPLRWGLTSSQPGTVTLETSFPAT